MRTAIDPFLPVRRDVSVSEARELVLSFLHGPHVEERSVSEAFGTLLAEPVFAREDSPPFDTAAMDGFAFRTQEVTFPVRMLIVDQIVAGDARNLVLAEGSAYRIMTGARLPLGADAVLPFELAKVTGDALVLQSSLPGWANIRRAGEEIQIGSSILDARKLIGSAQLALLVSQGIEQVSVFARPKVAVLATGDELKSQPIPNPASIHDSNSLMGRSLCERFGSNVVLVRAVGDDTTSLIDALAECVGREVDLIVTVGGASAGDRDVVTDLIRQGADLIPLDVRMKPGRPLIAGSIDGVPLIGLPGNPAAAFVSAMQFVQPAIQVLRGVAEPTSDKRRAVLSVDVPNPGGRTNFLRVVLEVRDGRLIAEPSGPQGAANLLTLAKADGLLVIPENCPLASAGDEFEVQLLAGL